MKNRSDHLNTFCALSEYLTGFGSVSIYGTGVLEFYFDFIADSNGSKFLNLLDEFRDLMDGHTKVQDLPEQKFYSDIFFHETYGSITKAITRLWFTGLWTGGDGVDKVVSDEGYLGAFVWQDFGAHPMGGKPGGFGSWSTPPRVTSNE